MRYLRLTIIFLLVLGLAASNTALAEEITVTSADPNIAVQGTLNLDIVITGTGLAETMTVKFLPICTKTNPCMDRKTGGIEVTEIKVADDGKEIIATIDIAYDADVVDFDIAVSSSSVRGRGGKGTTLGKALFKVQKKDVFACSEVFTLSDSSNCDCTFTVKDETGQQGTPPALIWTMQDECTTSETLVIKQFEVLSSDTATLTAVYPFNGSAVVAAQGHRANIFNFNIHIDAGVDAGCDPGQLRSAIGFVLDGDSLNTSENSSYRNTWWQVWNSTISTSGPALCHAMEFSRTDSYLFTGTIEGRVYIHSNVIMADSFTSTGILFRGFGPVNTYLNVSRNTIIGTTAAPAANAIQFGPIFGAGTVERNLISLGGGAGVGVLVVGVDDGLPTDVTVSQNEVAGAFIGVLVDEQVADATLKSNILTGDAVTDSGDIGVCSDAMNNTIRANKIKDFDDAVLTSGCTAMAQQAPE